MLSSAARKAAFLDVFWELNMWLLRLRKLLKSAGREGLILFYAIRHPMANPKLRLAAIAMFLYVLSPIDLIPDIAPLLGWADDAALLLLGIPFLLKKLPANILSEATASAERLLAKFSLFRSAR
jgi:uncharacterized membrane protein YkvA (DUF1232 family)